MNAEPGRFLHSQQIDRSPVSATVEVNIGKPPGPVLVGGRHTFGHVRGGADQCLTDANRNPSPAQIYARSVGRHRARMGVQPGLHRPVTPDRTPAQGR
jgi:hypothetical protein